MKLELQLELDVKIENDSININGIIKAVHQSLNAIGLSILKEILESIDREVCTKIMAQEPFLYRNKGYAKRTFKTPMGMLKTGFLKLCNIITRKVVCPGKEALSVPAFKQWLPWCLVPAAGLLSKVSYVRSSKEAALLQGSAPSKSTLHRRLEDLIGDGAFTPYLKKRWFRYLMVDGTGARFQNRKESDEPTFYEGEIRFAFAAIKENSPFELVGIWVNKSWQDCANELYSRMSTERLEALICDGGPGIEEAFIREGMRVQRCHWHGKRDLSFILYQDGIKKAQQEEIMQKLSTIPTVGWTKKQVEEIRPEDNNELKELHDKILTGFCDLYFMLQSKGYFRAAEYISNLAKPYVSFIDHLIDHNELLPTTSNIIESKISLFKNRIKSIGKRWSEDGLLRWLALAVRKLLPEYNWKTLWDKITGNPLPAEITLTFMSRKVVCH